MVDGREPELAPVDLLEHGQMRPVVHQEGRAGVARKARRIFCVLLFWIFGLGRTSSLVGAAD